MYKQQSGDGPVLKTSLRKGASLRSTNLFRIWTEWGCHAEYYLCLWVDLPQHTGMHLRGIPPTTKVEWTQIWCLDVLCKGSTLIFRGLQSSEQGSTNSRAPHTVQGLMLWDALCISALVGERSESTSGSAGIEGGIGGKREGREADRTINY